MKNKALILNRIANSFAVSAPVVMILSAVLITLLEGDWWFNLFLVYLGAIIMITVTLYLSLLALMKECVRYIQRKNASDTPVVKWIHLLLTGVSIAGMITFALLVLILFDVLSGGFALLHFACGVIIVLLYVALWICCEKK